VSLDNRVKALVAVGAAVSANCQPCLESTLALAQESGVEESEIVEAIEVGKMIRRGAASKMDKFAASFGGAGLAEPVAASAAQDSCGCH
jgi:AhpD family alkylhydroperoxidase